MKAILNGEAVEVPGDTMTELPVNVPGVFETVLWRTGTPVFWAEHWARFDAGCSWYSIAAPFAPTLVLDHARWLARENGVTCGVLRFAAWKAEQRTCEWRLELGPPRPHMRRSTLTVGAGPVLPVATPDRAYKHLGRGPWTDALKRARGAGCDEVLLCDQSGRVVEGAVSNVFFVRDGRLHTPPLELGGLPGVMRRQILLLAAASGDPVCETGTTIDELATADELWLTNSLIGAKPVHALGEHVFPTRRPLLDRFRASFDHHFGWDPAHPCGDA